MGVFMTPPSQPPQPRLFAKTREGHPVEAWHLRGSGGLELEVLTYGAVVRRLIVPDPSGIRRDVVLGYNDLALYESRAAAYAGSVAGRIAGRVPDGIIQVDGKRIELPLNDGGNHLHGGQAGIDRKIWQAKPVEREDGWPSIRMSCTSPDGEGGYPGTVSISATYTLTADNALLFETEVASDQPTPASLTHHSYFNLGGEGSGSVEDHELAIFSDETVAVDDQMTPLGKRLPVKGQAPDLTSPKRIGDILPHFFDQHGDLYCLDRPEVDNRPRRVARLTHPPTGQTMEVSTTHGFLQFYSGVKWDGSTVGKSAKPYERCAGLCLEAEEYPAATTQPGFGDIIVRPGHPVRHLTEYAFNSKTSQLKR